MATDSGKGSATDGSKRSARRTSKAGGGRRTKRNRNARWRQTGRMDSLNRVVVLIFSDEYHNGFCQAKASYSQPGHRFANNSFVEKAGLHLCPADAPPTLSQRSFHPVTFWQRNAFVTERHKAFHAGPGAYWREGERRCIRWDSHSCPQQRAFPPIPDVR